MCCFYRSVLEEHSMCSKQWGGKNETFCVGSRPTAAQVRKEKIMALGVSEESQRCLCCVELLNYNLINSSSQSNEVCVPFLYPHAQAVWCLGFQLVHYVAQQCLMKSQLSFSATPSPLVSIYQNRKLRGHKYSCGCKLSRPCRSCTWVSPHQVFIHLDQFLYLLLLSAFWGVTPSTGGVFQQGEGLTVKQIRPM